MATIYHQLHPIGAVFGDPSSAPFPQATIRYGNYSYSSLLYDDATDEAAFWRRRAVGYGSGNLTVDILWWATSATSGNVVWGAAIAVITPNSDTQDISTDSLATEQTVTDGHLGTTAKRLHRASITVSNLDSLAADDFFTIRVRRLGTNGSDTMSGDAELTLVTVSYSD